MPQYRLLPIKILYYTFQNIAGTHYTTFMRSEIIATSLAVPLIGTVAIAIFSLSSGLNLVVMILIITLSDHDT